MFYTKYSNRREWIAFNPYSYFRYTNIWFFFKKRALIIDFYGDQLYDDPNDGETAEK